MGDLVKIIDYEDSSSIIGNLGFIKSSSNSYTRMWTFCKRTGTPRHLVTTMTSSIAPASAAEKLIYGKGNYNEYTLYGMGIDKVVYV